MSFILDALNRSEKERKDNGPGKPDTNKSAGRRQRAPWAIVVVALLVVSTAALSWVWRDAIVSQVKRFTADPPAVASQQPTAIAETDKMSSSTERPANKRNKAANGTARPEGGKQRRGNENQPNARSAGKGAKMTAVERKAARVAERQAQRRQNKTQKNQAGKNAVAGNAPASNKSPENELVPVVDTLPNNPANARAAAPRSKTVAIGGPQLVQPEASREGGNESGPSTLTTEPASDYTLVHELPLGVRVNLPDIQLNMHVYHQNPGSRFVMINMRRFQVGDTMEDLKIKVQGIEPEGVVLQFQGHDFLLPNG